MVSNGLYCPRAGIASWVLNLCASKNGGRMLPWKFTGNGLSSSCCLSQMIGLSKWEKSGMTNWQSSCSDVWPGDVWCVWGSVCISIALASNTKHLSIIRHKRPHTRRGNAAVTSCRCNYTSRRNNTPPVITHVASLCTAQHLTSLHKFTNCYHSLASGRILKIFHWPLGSIHLL